MYIVKVVGQWKCQHLTAGNLLEASMLLIEVLLCSCVVQDLGRITKVIGVWHLHTGECSEAF